MGGEVLGVNSDQVFVTVYFKIDSKLCNDAEVKSIG